MTATFVAGSNTASSYAAATTVTLSKPSGVTDGDLLIAAITHTNSAFDLTCAGWSPLAGLEGLGGSTARLNVFVKYASGEPASWAFGTFVSNSLAAAVCVSYRQSVAVIGGASLYQSPSNTASIVLPSITDIYGNATVIAILAACLTGPPSIPSGMTSRASVSVTGTGPSIRICDELRPISGATGSRTATCSNGPAAGWLLEFQPSAWGGSLFAGVL